MEPKKLIQSLVDSGKSEDWIASEVNREAGDDVVTQATINRIKNGKSKNPGYRTVQRLEQLYERHVPKEGEAA